MAHDRGWLYLLAGAGTGAALVTLAQRNAQAGGPARPPGAAPLAGPPPATPAPSPGTRQGTRQGERVVRAPLAPVAKGRSVFLHGDELAEALAPHLSRLLADKRVPLQRNSGAGWSTTWAQMGFAREGDAMVIALSHAFDQVRTRPPLLPRDIATYAQNFRGAGARVVVVASGCTKGRPLLAQVAREAGVAFYPLPDLPCAPDGRTPSVATSAAWATYLARELGVR